MGKRKTQIVPLKRFVVMKYKQTILFYTLFPLCFLSSYLSLGITYDYGNLDSIESYWNMCLLWIKCVSRGRRKTLKLIGDDASLLSVCVILCDTVFILCVGAKNSQRWDTDIFRLFKMPRKTFRKFQFWKFISVQVLS